MKYFFVYCLFCLELIACNKTVLNKTDNNQNITSPNANVTVDAAITDNDISSKYRGINITENWENQSYWNYSISPATTINAIKPNIIRFGGDDYFWADPPYTLPKSRLINYGTNEFLSQQSAIIESDGVHFKNRLLNIDDFVNLCRATECEPEIIVPYNRIYYTPLIGGNINTEEDFLRNAESLVRYCNITKGYKIKFWEIGNETWNKNSGNNRGITADEYAADIKKFSQRMKAVDPTIKIIVNGNSTNWFRTVLAANENNVDFINISFYPDFSIFSNYEDYLANNIDFGADQNIVNALTAINSTANTGKIKLIITEFNAISFGGPWKDNNDLGHALVTFQMGADLVNNPNIYFSSFWNLRWYFGNQSAGIPWLPIDTNPKTAFNAAENQGNLNPNGQSLALLYNNMFGAMVSSISDNKLIRSYSCYDKVSGRMNIFLINKDITEQLVKINLKSISKTSGQVFVFTGNSDTDTQPAITSLGNLSFNNDSATLSLKPVSIYLIKL